MTFEVQTYKNGSWTISSVEGDKDAAIYEAQRLLKGKRTTAARVVQELYDEQNDSYRMKVIFKRSRAEESSPSSSSDGGGRGGRAVGGRNNRAQEEEDYEPTFFQKLKVSIRLASEAFFNSVFYLVLKFSVIIGLGLWLLVTMNDLADKL